MDKRQEMPFFFFYLWTMWQRRRPVHEAVQAYVNWRRQCVAVWETYDIWKAASVTEAPLAFEAYSVALEREERASEVYADWIRRSGDLIRYERRPMADLAPLALPRVIGEDRD
jgi:hypothetical protein